jgi:hypothetical protein
MPDKEPPKNHTNIFALGQRFVKDTQTVLTVELCARIAVMVCFLPLPVVMPLNSDPTQREQYVLHPGDDFWDELDNHLTWMREEANFDENKIAKYAA